MTSSKIEEPEDSLIMEDEDINTIPKKESDEENKSSVENLFYIPSESEVTFDNESEYDLLIFDDFSSLYDSRDNCVIFFGPFFDSYGDTTSSEYSSDNDSFLEEDNTEKFFLDLPFEFDKESISSDLNPIYDEVLEDINGTNYRIDSIIDSFKIDPLLEEFTELNFEFSIESFSPSPILVKDSDSLMEEIDTFLASDDSIPPSIDSDGNDSEEVNFFIKFEADPGDLTRVVVEYMFGEPRVHVPNVLPAHPTFSLDSDFTPSDNFSGSDLVVSFPSGNRNKTFNSGISIDVQSKRFLSPNDISISFISDPLSPVLETLLPFSSENEDKVFNPEILVSKEEKSPHLLSHQGLQLSRSFIISVMKA
nr:hypothetical protein [Tanacetum cinerariifolium]